MFPQEAMKAMLERHGSLLDSIFGSDGYQIAAAHPEQATIRLSRLDASFGCERDGEIVALITLRDPPAGTSGIAITSLWGRFLGLETQSKARDKSGRVQATSDDQLLAELAILDRLNKEVFAEPQKFRDAAFFVSGYTRAYNDWATGGGSWG